MMKSVMVKRFSFPKEYLLFIEGYSIPFKNPSNHEIICKFCHKELGIRRVLVEWEAHKILGQVVEGNTKHRKKQFMSSSGIYLLKGNNENTRIMCKNCSKLPIKTSILLQC